VFTLDPDYSSGGDYTRSPSYGGGVDLDCSDISGPVVITGSDPNGFDADGDGIGCE